jgi:phosphohistidine phosphatase
MRRLLLMRHAKAERGQGKDDFDRTLMERGWQEADQVAANFTAAGLVPDRVLCSASRRTRDTLCAVMPYLTADCVAELRNDLYDADVSDLRAVLAEASGDCVLLIGHNPAIHGLAVALAGDTAEARVLAGGFPTSFAALFALPFGIDTARFERLFTR